MGIGCRRDPLEANVWYVKAADQGDERAKHRIAAIRAAASGGHNSNRPLASTAPKAGIGGQVDGPGGLLQDPAIVAAADSSSRGKSQDREGAGEKKGRKWGIF